MNGPGIRETPPRKYVLIVLDGLGDLPTPDLGGKTPLEDASTPNLDLLTATGESGTLYPVRKGVAPESDAGVLGLLGYDPETESPGRGVLEAMGSGMELEKGDVALRFNFATAGPDGTIVDQRVGRGLSTEEAISLASTLTDSDLLCDEHVSARIVATVGHRGVVHLKPLSDEPLSPDVSNSDPFYERVDRTGHAVRPGRPAVKKVLPMNELPSSARTARVLNLLSERVVPILEGHGVNSARVRKGVLVANRVIMRDAGGVPTGIPTFEERYGVKGCAVTEMPVERGIARLLGLTDVYVGPMGPDAESGLRARAGRVREALTEHPFVYVHLKGPDVPGHDGDATRKRDVIERLDRFFVGPFVDGLDLTTTSIAVTADHSTPCIRKGHSDDPVPVLLSGERFMAPGRGETKFSERTAEKGSLGLIQGRQLIPLLLDSHPHERK